MPRTVTKTVYTFAELEAEADRPDSNVSRSAVDAAFHWLAEGNTDHDWWDCIYDVWLQALESVGFHHATIQFSGFSSQGDGASFTCDDVRVGQLVAFLCGAVQPSQSIEVDEKGNELFAPWVAHRLGGIKPLPAVLILPDLIDDIRMSVQRTSHNYSHEHTCRLQLEWWGPLDSPDLVSLLEEPAEELRADLCHLIYEDLQKEYEFLTSEEVVRESAEANGYTFDEDGNPA